MIKSKLTNSKHAKARDNGTIDGFKSHMESSINRLFVVYGVIVNMHKSTGALLPTAHDFQHFSQTTIVTAHSN